MLLEEFEKIRLRDAQEIGDFTNSNGILKV